MKCPNCNKEINDSFKFCPYCATPIVANKCPHCGSTNLPPDSKFCPDCGGKIESVEEFKYQTFNVNGVAFKMIQVEGGTFMMSAHSKRDEDYAYFRPTRQVTLSSYSIGETTVTQELWMTVMGSNPCYVQGDKLPVYEVSWNDCQEFIMKLNKKTGKKFRMPTDAEWEFAALGGNKSKHYRYSGSNNIDEVAWYDGNSSHMTHPHPVKQKKPNELGMYDMTGNVHEWCQDWCDDTHNKSSCPQTNPKGPISGECRALRGGDCWTNEYYCRSAHQSGDRPGNRGYRSLLGLRLALSVEQQV